MKMYYPTTICGTAIAVLSCTETSAAATAQATATGPQQFTNPLEIQSTQRHELELVKQMLRRSDLSFVFIKRGSKTHRAPTGRARQQKARKSRHFLDLVWDEDFALVRKDEHFRIEGYK